MSMHRMWKACPVVFFLVIFLFLVLDPASAAAKSNSGSNKYKQKVTVHKITSKKNISIKQILTHSKGPKINNPGAGWYEMNYGKNKGKWKHKYFKNGHPQNHHLWHWCYAK
ncbi:hypothetical protein ACFL2E_12520 [Thermodesulfobacteriota bacterium]